MNEHITADDREILDMLHDVIYKATNKDGDYDEWLLNKHKTIKTLTDILVGLIVNTQSHTAPPKQPEQEPVAHLWECIGRWTAMIAHDGEEANLAPPDWLIDAVKAATAPVDAVNMSQECVDETAKHEHEPVAKVKVINGDIWGVEWLDRPPLNDTPLYTAPPKREWVSATHIEIGNLWAKHKEVYGFAIALDKLLQDKNR